jgi:hypothetical protein
MAVTYRELGEDGHYEMIVRVRTRSKVRSQHRAYELSLEDVEGTRFQFIVWTSSDQGTNCDWKEGCWYRLGGVTANVWPSGTVPHGTSSLVVEYLGPARNRRRADILYATDSHLGKTSHSYSGSSWPISPENGFHRAIEAAISMDVDAVVHGGDLFHNPGDGIGSAEIALCREGLAALAESGIPFYFIYGNHERQAGRRVMSRFVDDSLAEHLGPRYDSINDAVAVYGIDYQSDWADFVPDLERAPDSMSTILFVHQSISPFSESKRPDCSLRDVHEGVNVPVDLVVTGHVHTRTEELRESCRGVSGGATARVGQSRSGLQPSVELISTGGEVPEVKRLSL